MKYIVDFNPVIIENINNDKMSSIESKIINKEPVEKNDIDYFLDVIVFLTRLNINRNMDDFSFGCDKAQSILSNYLEKLDCFTSLVATHHSITSDIAGHSFLVSQFNVEGKGITNYLIDPTYIQFFKRENCSMANYFVSPKYPDIILIKPDPGFFISSDNLPLISNFLNHGFIELSSDIARIYGDSFYNTKVGGNVCDIGFKSIPGDVYINAFLKGKENASLIDDKYMIPLFSESDNKKFTM